MSICKKCCRQTAKMQKRKSFSPALNYAHITYSRSGVQAGAVSSVKANVSANFMPANTRKIYVRLEKIKPLVFSKKVLANPALICYIGSRGTRFRSNETKGVSNMIKDEYRNNKNEMCQYGMESTNEQSDTKRALNKSNKLSDLIGGLSR